MYLSRDAILKADDLVTEAVDVPEWGGKVNVRGLSGTQRDNWEASLVERRGRKMVQNTYNIRAKLVVQCVVDDKGKRLFTDGDAEELGKKSAAPIDRIFAVASKLSGVNDDDVEEMVQDFENQNGSASPSS